MIAESCNPIRLKDEVSIMHFTAPHKSFYTPKVSFYGRKETEYDEVNNWQIVIVRE